MKTSRKIIRIATPVLAIVLLAAMCCFSFMYMFNFWIIDSGRSLTAEETEIVSLMLGFDIAPDDEFYPSLEQGFWPRSIDRLWGKVYVASEGDFLARCHEKTAFELHSYNYAGKDNYCAELSIGRDSEFMTKELEHMLNNDWQLYFQTFVLFWTVLAGKVVLIAALIIKRRRAKKEKPQAARERRVKGLLSAIVLVPLLCSALFFFMYDFVDKWHYRKFTPEQQIIIAEALGFDIAPEETLTASYNQFLQWPGELGLLSVDIYGIPSEEDFLSRCHEETLFSWDNNRFHDASFFNGDSRYTPIPEIENIIASNRWQYYLAYRVFLGAAAAEPVLVVTLIVTGIVNRRKAKKKCALAAHTVGDGLPDVPG